MKVREIVRYCHELGWTDPPDLSASIPTSAADCKSLQQLVSFVDGCTRCRLSERRQQIVFGEGHPQAQLMFVGEAPGADEDRSGRPFVGQAGQLLDAMIFALGFERDQVFIANVVKCRPPGNRDPEEEEKAACAAFLERQIELIQPRVIIALGKPAAHRLIGTTKPMSALHGRWAAYQGTPVLPTFHPAYLLRNPLDKRMVWNDLKKAREKL
jgi:DNA polymerase